MSSVVISKILFDKYAALIKSSAGISLKESKSTLLSNRLRHRLKHLNIATFEEYYDYVCGNSIELEHMVNAVSTNETYFFRNIQHYELLMEAIIPELIDLYNRPVKIWSAGCSSGEEAYTLCMLLKERGLLDKRKIDIHATDINTEMLRDAKVGIYGANKMRSTEEYYLKRYFTQVGKDKFLIDENISNFVRFDKVNLKTDVFKEKYDIIIFRNVMIYFEKEDQEFIIGKFYDALNSGSYFIIGHSESLYFIKSKFKYKKILNTPIYYRDEL